MIDRYFDLLKDISSNKDSKHNLMVHVEHLLDKSDCKLLELLDLQKIILTAHDSAAATGYLEIGHFTNCNVQDRIALFTICLEIQREKQRTELKELCAEYDKKQKIFSESKLFDHLRKSETGKLDYELLSLEVFKSDCESEIIENSGLYYKLHPFLNPYIVWWSKQLFPSANIFVRVDHRMVWRNKPKKSLNEEVLVPANPSWWKKLQLYKSQRTGASYYIEAPDNAANNQKKYWEYYVDKIRTMQLSASRNSSGNLSMMFEEISEYYMDSGILMGLCIHLDSDSPYGTSNTEAQLNHLDLAINFYEGDAVKRRMNTDLSKGKVEDATFRTHLFRIENIPFNAVIAYVVLFFKSKSLVREWLNEQIKNVG